MSLSELVIKAIGVLLAVVGVALILAVVGVNFLGVSAPFGPLGGLIIGAILLGVGIYVIRGGSISA